MNRAEELRVVPEKVWHNGSRQQAVKQQGCVSPSLSGEHVQRHQQGPMAAKEPKYPCIMMQNSVMHVEALKDRLKALWSKVLVQSNRIR